MDFAIAYGLLRGSICGSFLVCAALPNHQTASLQPFVVFIGLPTLALPILVAGAAGVVLHDDVKVKEVAASSLVYGLCLPIGLLLPLAIYYGFLMAGVTCFIFALIGGLCSLCGGVLTFVITRGIAKIINAVILAIKAIFPKVRFPKLNWRFPNPFRPIWRSISAFLKWMFVR